MNSESNRPLLVLVSGAPGSGKMADPGAVLLAYEELQKRRVNEVQKAN
ncbi:MAG TPA: hypothetical protein VIS56_00770 [Candidatus Saccharimonadales bacterium]